MIAALAALLIASALLSFFRYAHTGKAIRVCADKHFGAQVVGLDEKNLYAATYGIGAACIGRRGQVHGPLRMDDGGASCASARGLPLRLTSQAHTDAVRTGAFTYLSASVANSLYRNGKVFTRRDTGGNDSGTTGVDLEERQMPVHDARRLSGSQRRTLDVQGFELLERPLGADNIDFLNHDEVVGRYYPQCANIVREASAARHVAAFDHNIRSALGNRSERRSEGGQPVQPPIHLVHGDYTLTSGPQRLRDLAKPPTTNDTYRTLLSDGGTLLDETSVTRTLEAGRFAIINLWRNISSEPVAAHPLALCDATSVHPDDLVVFEIHYADRIGENYFAKHSDDHRWYCYPALTRDEPLLIKQWDSAGGLARSKGANGDATSPDSPCTFSFHSAFEDPTTAPDAPDRWSIEVRCVVFYD